MQEQQSCCVNVLMRILSFFLALLLGIAVLCFFFFLGLPYEFVILYTNKQAFDEEGAEDNNIRESEELQSKEYTCGDYTILVLIIIAGIALQPLYLIFYFVWGFMWFIKEYGWWCFIADYNF